MEPNIVLIFNTLRKKAEVISFNFTIPQVNRVCYNECVRKGSWGSELSEKYKGRKKCVMRWTPTTVLASCFWINSRVTCLGWKLALHRSICRHSPTVVLCVRERDMRDVGLSHLYYLDLWDLSILLVRRYMALSHSME